MRPLTMEMYSEFFMSDNVQRLVGTFQINLWALIGMAIGDWFKAKGS